MKYNFIKTYKKLFFLLILFTELFKNKCSNSLPNTRQNNNSSKVIFMGLGGLATALPVYFTYKNKIETLALQKKNISEEKQKIETELTDLKNSIKADPNQSQAQTITDLNNQINTLKSEITKLDLENKKLTSKPVLASSTKINTETKAFFTQPKKSNKNPNGYENGNVSKEICTLIKNAKLKIIIAMYSFTDKDIFNELIEAHKKGILIEIVSDIDAFTSTTTAGTLTPNLKKELAKAFKNNNKLKNAKISIFPTSKMHNKFIIVDKKLLGTGSYNFTGGAKNNNAENFLITSDLNLIKEYTDNFYDLQKISKELQDDGTLI